MNSSLTVDVLDDTDHDTSMMGDQATAIMKLIFLLSYYCK